MIIKIVVFSDFNWRIGEKEDFIIGVDTLPLRDIKDFQTNEYCNSFITGFFFFFFFFFLSVQIYIGTHLVYGTKRSKTVALT